MLCFTSLYFKLDPFVISTSFEKGTKISENHLINGYRYCKKREYGTHSRHFGKPDQDPSLFKNPDPDPRQSEKPDRDGSASKWKFGRREGLTSYNEDMKANYEAVQDHPGALEGL